MIRVLSYPAATTAEPVDATRLAEFLAEESSEQRIIWVDLLEPTPEEEEQVLAGIFKFHPLAIEDCQRERLTPGRGVHLPKVEDYGEYLYTIINPIAMESFDATPTPTARRDLSTRQLNVFLGQNYIVTHHYEKLHAIESAMTSCSRNPHFMKRGPDYLYHLVLDDIVDQYTPMLDAFDREIDQLEEEVFRRPSRRTLLSILAMKRKIFGLRRITMYQREMVYRLSRGEFELISQEEIAYYRNVYDHMVRATELAESYRDTMTSLLDAYMSMSSNRMNEVMKVLTMFSTFFLPLSFIAGVYGMNFDTSVSPFNMPELHWVYGYPFALGLMALVGIGLWVFFRNKKWL